MTSLYRRATPSQQRILRAVEGAVKNACDAHGDQKYDKGFARSIAKRAAGTLTAEWPEVLAARLARRQAKRAPNLCEGSASSEVSHRASGSSLWRASQATRRPPLKAL